VLETPQNFVDSSRTNADSEIKMGLEDVDMQDSWEDTNQTQWRGLGLTDPVKNVEVRPNQPQVVSHSVNGLFIRTGQVAALTRLS